MKKAKVDNRGVAEANAAVAAAQEAANNLAKNFKTDLTNENISNVVAGGTAADSAVAMEQGGRKKRSTGSLSSQLGINV